MLLLILPPIILFIFTYPIYANHYEVGFTESMDYYLIILILNLFVIMILSATTNIEIYLAKPFLKKKMISNIKYYNENYRIYDGICATSSWDIKCINEDDFTYIDTNESIDFNYRIIIGNNSMTITENQYETLNKIKKEYNDKYNGGNPLLLLTTEQFVALQNNSVLNGDISVV